jgi:hypothetical protein
MSSEQNVTTRKSDRDEISILLVLQGLNAIAELDIENVFHFLGGVVARTNPYSGSLPLWANARSDLSRASNMPCPSKVRHRGA